MEVAKAAKIPLQHESSSRFTGTDTDSIFIQQGGIPSSLVSLPLRYMHSVVEMADWRDIEQVIELLVGFARSVGPNDDFRVRL
jgi:endoglucanase